MSKVLTIDDVIIPHQLATHLSNRFQTWEMKRDRKLGEWKEIQEYVFATDTTMTSNSKLPWSNKTTIPKLCQIRDNLHSNYMAAMFPKRKWMEWQGSSFDDNSAQVRECIESYMQWVVDRNEYYNTVSQLVYDYIDYGNCFVMPIWEDQSQMVDSEHREQTGYVGPMPMRISPLDITFDPTAPSFERAPKFIRSMISLGEVKEILEKQATTDEDKEDAKVLYQYLIDYRARVSQHPGATVVKDRIYNISGFDTFRSYLESGTCEILTYYGDVYDQCNDKFYKNVVIKIVDRHKIIYNKPNPSAFGYAPIFHAGWRLRPDNLWASGPLDNLVGMQYRIDHLENMKADCFDLIAYPPLTIKGYVEDFEWGPMERIYLGDDGDVKMLSPDTAALQADNQIAMLEAKMEEMSGSPKEAMGFRTPGEKTKYEVQSLENAASRIFQNKIQHFERHIVENLLNGMLELARRNVNTTTIRIMDDEFKFATFMDLSNNDLTGSGRLRPMAARHFAEKANMVQNLNTFLASAAFKQVAQHVSSVRMAKVWEDLLEIQEYKVIEPYIALSEQADQQRLANAHEQNLNMEGQTPTNILPGDMDPNALNKAVSAQQEQPGQPPVA